MNQQLTLSPGPAPVTAAAASKARHLDGIREMIDFVRTQQGHGGGTRSRSNSLMCDPGTATAATTALTVDLRLRRPAPLPEIGCVHDNTSPPNLSPGIREDDANTESTALTMTNWNPSTFRTSDREADPDDVEQDLSPRAQGSNAASPPDCQESPRNRRASRSRNGSVASALSCKSTYRIGISSNSSSSSSNSNNSNYDNNITDINNSSNSDIYRSPRLQDSLSHPDQLKLSLESQNVFSGSAATVNPAVGASGSRTLLPPVKRGSKRGRTRSHAPDLDVELDVEVPDSYDEDDLDQDSPDVEEFPPRPSAPPPSQDGIVFGRSEQGHSDNSKDSSDL